MLADPKEPFEHSANYHNSGETFPLIDNIPYHNFVTLSGTNLLSEPIYAQIQVIPKGPHAFSCKWMTILKLAWLSYIFYLEKIVHIICSVLIKARLL